MKQFLLTTILCLSFTISSFAQHSGKLTETMTWNLDAEGTLTISGTGMMPDYFLGSPYMEFRSLIQKVVISDGVTSIGGNAFDLCTRLTSVTIPDGVTSIGMGAFSSCINLASITISSSVTSIGIGAFFGCQSLTSVTIPNSVTSIGERAFYHCEGLTSITILEGVTWIGNMAFAECRNLPSITIPNSVTNIGERAFEGCRNLTSIIIPNSVMEIGNAAFINCTGLTSITIPNSIRVIPNYAFSNCTSLTSVTISENITHIGTYAFRSCESLTSIDVNPGNSNYKSENGVLFNKSMTTLIQYPAGKQGKYTIPNSVTSFGNDAFSYCIHLTSIIIPGSVTNIGNNLFNGCDELKRIECHSLTPPVVDEYSLYYYKIMTKCMLYVPAESLDAYKAAEGWKAFDNIFAIPSVVVEEPKPTEGNKGSIDFSLKTPSNASITGSFNIQLPEGYTLDETTTFLSETLAGLFNLIITAVGDNTWHIEIVSNGLRTSHNLPEYTKIMSIGYIIDESVSNGNYQIELKDINMQMEDGTVIEQESIRVTTEVRREEGTGLSSAEALPIRVYSTQGSIVVENAPIGETIHIYNVSGVLVATIVETQYFASVQTTIALPQGMYIVKVGEISFKVVSGK